MHAIVGPMLKSENIACETCSCIGAEQYKKFGTWFLFLLPLRTSPHIGRTNSDTSPMFNATSKKHSRHHHEVALAWILEHPVRRWKIKLSSEHYGLIHYLPPPRMPSLHIGASTKSYRNHETDCRSYAHMAHIYTRDVCVWCSHYRQYNVHTASVEYRFNLRWYITSIVLCLRPVASVVRQKAS